MIIYECAIFTHDGNGDFATRESRVIRARDQRDAWGIFVETLQGNDAHRDALRNAFIDIEKRHGGDVWDAYAFGEYAGDYARECSIVPLASTN